MTTGRVRTEYGIRCGNGDVGMHDAHRSSDTTRPWTNERDEAKRSLRSVAAAGWNFCGPHSIVQRTITTSEWH